MSFPPRNLEEVKGIRRETLLFDFSFATNGASNPVASANRGKGFSVIRAGTGVYTVTFTDSFPGPGPVFCNAHLSVQAATPRWAQASTFTAATATTPATLVIVTVDAAGAAQDVGAAANSRVNVLMTWPLTAGFE
jgi:hypothetical protein